ncbi:unnamed protein product [Closterium sp. Naga37s-1]|nr:unnamed protein product [Closterium sp. Naga37s-1]
MAQAVATPLPRGASLAVSRAASSTSKKTVQLVSPAFSSFSLSQASVGRCFLTSGTQSRSLSFSRVARRAVVRSQATTEEAPIAFQIGETSLSIPFSVEKAKALDAAISTLLQTFREKEKATRPQRWTTMEYRHAGDVSNGDVFIEIFCNPNAYANAFQAKALITVKDDRMKFTSEGALSAIKANVDEYLMRNA